MRREYQSFVELIKTCRCFQPVMSCRRFILLHFKDQLVEETVTYWSRLCIFFPASYAHTRPLKLPDNIPFGIYLQLCKVYGIINSRQAKTTHCNEMHFAHEP